MNIPLSKLVADPRNARRVKPEREAHKRLVASIRAHGLLEPLVVRPENGHFHVVAGKRRLAAMRDIHDGKFSVPCVLRKVGAAEAEELSLAENFQREPMHPLDEAEAFARMASEDRKGVKAIAAEFGVSERYVQQRMKLAGLCGVVKDAYRAGTIDTGTAEAFAAVPAQRQEEVWKECGGNPRHAQHVRNLIEDRWIDARHALFDVATLPQGSVSTDLFRQTVLVERRAFMEAQATALTAEKAKLHEEGWAEVVIGERAGVRDRLYSMAEPELDLSKPERAKLEKLDAAWQEAQEGEEDDDAISAKLEAIDSEIEAVTAPAKGRFGEETKARATVFLVVSPEGSIERHYRVPRPGPKQRAEKGKHGVTGEPESRPPPPTANDLSHLQRSAVRTHEALAVREAVLGSAIVRKRLLVLALHDKVRADGLAVRRDANGTTLHAQSPAGLKSDTFARLRTKRGAIDPFKAKPHIEEEDAYRALCKLPEKSLDALIAVLITDCLTGHGQRETPLIELLGAELKVSVRKHWTPDADWLAGYQKFQLADLLGTLKGKVYGTAALSRKKSELVEELTALFAQAANATGGDPKLAERVNRWMPAEPN